ncbi:MAG TPA: hypothetical protein VFX68_01845 [Sulfuricurvum sp.]|nr:hypothetical protein [Sulfuricurvum sp.]
MLKKARRAARELSAEENASVSVAIGMHPKGYKNLFEVFRWRLK